MSGLRSLKGPLSQMIGTFKMGCLRPHSGQATWRTGELMPIQEKALIPTRQQKLAAVVQKSLDSERDVAPAESAEGVELSNLTFWKEIGENEDSPPLTIQCDRVLALVMPKLLGGHAFDPFTLPLRACQPSVDDIHVRDQGMPAIRPARNESPAVIFTGFLDSSPYQLYCVNLEKDSPLSAIHPSPLSEFEQQIMLCATPGKPSKVPSNDGKPSEAQLLEVSSRLTQSLPEIFTRGHDYKMYHENIIFQNGIRGVTTYGLPAYVQQLALIRMLAHLRYSHVKVELLKVTQHTEDSTIRVRWRIVGVSGLRVLFLFWKYRLWEWKKMMDNADWIDGFSIFHVDGNGLIYKHICDKVIPDQNLEESKPSNMALKLALLLGLTPKSGLFEDLEALCVRQDQLLSITET